MAQWLLMKQSALLELLKYLNAFLISPSGPSKKLIVSFSKQLSAREDLYERILECTVCRPCKCRGYLNWQGDGARPYEGKCFLHMLSGGDQIINEAGFLILAERVAAFIENRD
jgi:hypothetical protein